MTVLYKTTKKLYMGKYRIKVVVLCAGANWFRSGDWDGALEQLKRIDINTGTHQGNPFYTGQRSNIKTQDDLDYAFKLQNQLSKLKDIEIRVETPWISVYTNTKANINALVNLNPSKIKYVSVPPISGLEENTIILPKINYDYRVTIGRTTHENSTFIQWAEGNAKLKLTKSVKKELAKNRSWGGTYFYVSGDNNLLMAKMHLAGSINKVERIIKA